MSKIVDKDERRAHILDAALRVFATKGAVGLKIRDIAAEAKVAKGTVYLYFESKEAILHAIMHHGGDDEDLLGELLRSPVPARERLHLLVSVFVQGTLNGPYPLEFMPELWATVIRSNEKAHLRDRVAKTHAALREVLGELGADVHQAASLTSGLLAVFHGAIILHVLDPVEHPLERVTSTMVDAVIDSIQHSRGDEPAAP